MADQQSSFFTKAETVKKLGLGLLAAGAISIVISIVLLIASPSNFASKNASGIWSGFFIIIAGYFSFSAGSNDGNYGLRETAFKWCILAMIIEVISGIVNLIAIGKHFGCSTDCVYDSFMDRTDCTTTCDKSQAYIGSIFLVVLMVASFVVSLLSAVFVRKGSRANQQPIVNPNTSGYQATA